MSRLAALLVVALFPASGQDPIDAASLDGLRGKVTVITFISAVCPVANDYADRFSILFRARNSPDVRFVFVNANRNETDEDLRKNIAGNQYPFPVYRDRKGELARRYSAEVTPTAIVLDVDGKVRYSGAWDDAVNPARVRNRWVEVAITALLDGRPVRVQTTKPEG
jgi:hypothetical protein